MPTPPPQRAEPLTIAVKGLKVVIPTAVIISVTIFLTPGLAYLVVPTAPPPAGPVPLPGPQVPLLSSTPALMPALTMALPGTLPPPGPNQLRAGKCDERGSEVAINGGCWVATDKKPPCPDGIQWEYEKRCWRPVAEIKPVPTTGEVRVPGVANP